jgi:hypothetical protein
MNNNVPTAMRLGPVTGDNDRNLVSSWEVPAAPITIVVCCKLNGHLFTIVIFKYLHSVFKDASPAVVREDEILQALHDDWVKRCVALHSVIEGLARVIYI